MTALRDIAHVRAGDKGGTSMLGVVAYDPSDYPRLSRTLTPPLLAAHFHVAEDHVDVHDLPALEAMIIVVRDVLVGGVTRSLGIDPHGKTLSGHLGDLDLTEES